jgi:hypothetical protein
MLRVCYQLIVLFAISWSCLAQIPESTAPYVGIKVLVTNQVAHLFQWIDNDNLVVTSDFDDARGAFPSRVVVVNSISGKELLVVEKAHLLCANASESIFGVMQSNVSGSEPSIVFFKWNGSKERATEYVPDGHFDYLSCGHVASASDSQTRSAGRYLLRMGDGEIFFAHPDPDDTYKESMKLLLRKASGKTISLDADKQDLKRHEYVLHRQSYLLAPAYVAYPGTHWIVRGRKIFEQPMVMMSKEGVITRTPVPSALKAAQLKSETFGFPVALGELYVVGGQPSNGSGLYLARGEHVEKIWCTSAQLETTIPSFKPSCHPGSEVRISPDGCRTAFFGNAPRGRDNQLKVINICPTIAK